MSVTVPRQRSGNPNGATADAVFLAVAGKLGGSRMGPDRVRALAAAAIRAAAADPRLAERDFLVPGQPQEILQHIADALLGGQLAAHG